MTELPWKNILKVAKAVGYRSHTGSRGEGSGATPTCGFHIHVARNAFGQDQSERDAREAKLLVLFDKFWDKLVIFSRRDRSSLEHWAKRYAVFDVSKDKLDAIIHKAKSHSGTDRRMAVNICNQCGQAREQSTIEFRMFRGTTNYETIIATLQLIHMLVNETLKPTEDIQLLTWEEFRDSGCAKYKEFDAYIKRLQSHKKKI